MLNTSTNETDQEECIITNAEIWFNTIFLSIVVLLTLIGNAIALYAFFVSPELKKITYYFIASLCISDTMIALTSIPMWVVHTHFCWKNTPAFQTLVHVYLALDIFCGTWSIMCLAMISIERFVCIKYALHYYRIITKNRACYMLVFAFLYSAVVMAIEIAIDLIRVKDRETYDNIYERVKRTDIMVLQLFVVFLSYFLPVIIKLVSYQKIYSEASRQNMQIRTLRRFINNNNNDANDADIPEDSTSSDSKLSTNNTLLKQSSAETTSRVSWTVSSIGRKRQCTQERIKVLDDLNEEESICSDEIKEKRGRFNAIRLPGIISKFIGVSNRKNKNLRHEGSVKSTMSEDFDLSKKRTSHSLPLLRSRQTNDNIDIDDSSSDEEPTQLKVSSLQEKANILVCFEDNRKRSVSCPAYTPTVTRKSLEPNDIYTSIDNRNTGRKFTPTSSPLFQRLRAASKWSPANSPSLFRKSTRNRNDTKRREQKIRRFKKELRAAKVVGLIMGTFLFCWTPFMILILLDAVSVVIEVRPVMIAKDLHYLNSTLNPVLYVVLNKVYRQAVWKALRKLKLYLRSS